MVHKDTYSDKNTNINSYINTHIERNSYVEKCCSDKMISISLTNINKNSSSLPGENIWGRTVYTHYWKEYADALLDAVYETTNFH